MNGDREATNGFRGMVEAKLEAIMSWAEKHEREEFEFHRRVEGHMIDNARVLATSIENRADLARRISIVESDLHEHNIELRKVWDSINELRGDIKTLYRATVAVNILIVPILGWALFQLVEHLRGH